MSTNKEVSTKKETSTKKEVTTKKEATVKKVQAKLPQRDEYIMLKSIAEGRVIYDSRLTGLSTIWNEYGDVQEVQFAELSVMKSRKKYLEKWLVVEQGYMSDEEYELVIKHLGLSKLYEDIELLTDMGLLFDLEADDLEAKLRTMSNELKQTIAEIAIKKVETNELYDIRKINAIQRVLNIDLTL